MDFNWPAIGTALAGMAGGIWAYFQGRANAEVKAAADQAATSQFHADATVTDAASTQIKALLERVESLEGKYTKLWDDLQAEKQASSKLRDRVHQLEAILKAHSIEVPPEV